MTPRCALLLFIALHICSGIPSPAHAEPHFSNERFGEIRIFRKHRSPDAVVIFFSGKDGLLGDALVAVREVAESAMVIAIDSETYLRAIQRDDGDDSCTYLAGEVERLAQSVQQSLHLDGYHKAILMGYQQGAALALSVYGQFPEAFEQVATISFSPRLPLTVPPCNSEHLAFHKISATNGIEIRPNSAQYQGAESGFTWHALQGDGSSFPPQKLQAFQSTLEGSNVETMRGISDDPAQPKALLPALNELSKTFPRDHAESSSTGITGLPLVEYPPATKSGGRTGVIFLSGDGGWASIDKRIAEALVTAGLPVIGFDSLRYFWSERSPQEVARDLARVVDHYHTAWGISRFVLVGFSMGADVLPVVTSKLPKEIQRQIHRIALLSPSPRTDLEVHIGDWIGVSSDSLRYDLVAESKQNSDTPLACLYGKEDFDDSLCPLIKGRARVQVTEFPGSHHFDGAYVQVAEKLARFIGERS